MKEYYTVDAIRYQEGSIEPLFGLCEHAPLFLPLDPFPADDGTAMMLITCSRCGRVLRYATVVVEDAIWERKENDG